MKNIMHAVSSQQEKKVNNIINTPSSSSPYLQAVLSGALKLIRSEQRLDDRAAATRYIKESGLMRG